LREFFQWNIDIIGVDDVLADAEVIFCGIDYLKEIGLTPKDIVVRISSRQMLAAVLTAIGVDEDRLPGLYAVLDKRTKLADDAFVQMLAEQVPDQTKRQKILQLMAVKSIGEISSVVPPDGAAAEAVEKLKRLFNFLAVMGVGEYCLFDIGIVRGLAYYTGVVFEFYDRAAELRAIGGGGRYDDLLKQFGGPAIPATGFGMGDCVLGILLEEKGLLQRQLPSTQPDYFVAAADEKYFEKTIEIAARIRLAGPSANFAYRPAKLTKQLKQAAEQRAISCIIIGDEFLQSNLVVKNMMTGKQELVEIERFFDQLKA
jgi:histidyl-tRNA synthetase